MEVRALAFMVVRQALGVIGLGPSPDANDVEIVVLRHRLAGCAGRLPDLATPRPTG
jgi:hypothetical protein